jgi:hypothetical protein
VLARVAATKASFAPSESSVELESVGVRDRQPVGERDRGGIFARLAGQRDARGEVWIEVAP